MGRSKFQRYLQKVFLRRYELIKGEKTIKAADTKWVIVSYCFTILDRKSCKKIKIKIDTSYSLGEKQATPEDMWYCLVGGR